MKKMLMMCAVALAAFCARADTWTDPDTGVEWIYSIIGNEARIDGANPSAGVLTMPSELGGCFVGSIADSAFASRSALLGMVIPEGVRSIGKSAFAYCSGLTSVTIPSSLVSIGDSAFFECHKLTGATIPSGVKKIGKWAFKFCYVLSSLTISDGVECIGEGAFESCNSLICVKIPNSVTSLESWAFYNCEGLKSISLPEGLVNIGSYAMGACDNLTSIVIPSSVTSVGVGVFKNCRGLVSVRIPSSIESVSDDMFCFCTSLTSVALPSGITSIGAFAFDNCSSLLSIRIPPSVTSIGKSAFTSCDSLASITIPASMSSLGADAFLWCDSLCSLDFEGAPPDGVEGAEINSDAAIRYNIQYQKTWSLIAQGCGWTNAKPYDPYAPKPEGGPFQEWVGDVEWTFMVTNGEASVGGGSWNVPAVPTSTTGAITIPPTLGGHPVTSIGGYAFNSLGLTSVTMPDTVAQIGRCAFYECMLTNAELSAGLTYIGDYAFCHCCYLRGLSIPMGVSYVGTHAYEGCFGLEYIEVAEDNETFDSRGNCNALIETASNKLIKGCDNTVAPPGVISIGTYSFSNCRVLSAVKLPDSVATIESYAYFWCGALREITIPRNVTSIGEEAFAACPSLSHIEVDAANSVFDSRDNCNAIIETASGTLVCGCKNTVIPSGVTTLARSAFRGCPFTHIDIPEGLRVVGIEAFRDSALTDVKLPSTLEKIEREAFWGCNGLTHITIPARVSSMDYQVFDWCENLNAVDFEGAPPERVANASIKTDAAIRYNVAYYDVWQPIIEACGWTNATPYDPYNKYTTSRVISFNMRGANNADAATDAAGVVPVPVRAWNNFKNVNATYSGGVTWDGGAPVTLDENWTVTTSGNGGIYWWAPNGIESILRVYIDDNANKHAQMAFTDIPFGHYDVYVYMAADGINKNSPVSLITNGVTTTYTCGRSGVAYEGMEGWGQTQLLWSMLGANVICIRGQTAKDITIDGGTRGVTRGGIAAVQIVEVEDAPVYRAEMSEDTAWSAIKWLPEIPEEGFEKGAKLDLTVFGSPTLVFDESVALNCELTIRGTPQIQMVDELYENGCWQWEFAAFDILTTTDAVGFASVKAGYCGAYSQNTCGFVLRAQNRDVISINFANGQCVSGADYVGLAPVQGNTWMNMTETWGNPGKTVDLGAFKSTSDGINTVQIDTISGTCFARNTFGWNSATDVMLRGYLDDGMRAQVSIQNIPYACYDVIVYCATDISGGRFGPVTLNGTTYTYDDAHPEEAKVGDANWGSSHGLTAMYGGNTLRIRNVQSSSLTITGGKPASPVRGCIAAIQIVSTGNTWTDPETGITWTYTVSGNEANVGSGSSSSPAVPTSTTGEITIPSTLGGYPVTGISDFAFFGCRKLTSVTIPASVTNIGRVAFIYCDKLTSVTIPSSVTSIGYGAFEYCHGLTNVVIRPGVEKIADFAFFYCSGLTRINIPEGVRSIGELAFGDCNSLTNVVISSTVTNIGDCVFLRFANDNNGCPWVEVAEGNERYYSQNGVLFDASKAKLLSYPGRVVGTYDVPVGVLEIGDFAFHDCNLSEVTVPSTVTNIGLSAFWESESIKSVMLAEGLACIGDSAFSDCSGLTSVAIPSTVECIGWGAFSGCHSMEDLTISNGVVSICGSAFSDCRNLTEVTIPASVTNIGAGAFGKCGNLLAIHVVEDNLVYASKDGVLYNKEFTELHSCPGCKEDDFVVLPGIQNIGGAAFSGCGSLTSVVIADSVESIGESSFECCDSLQAVVIPDSVLSIGEYAFYNCTVLKSVTIGKGVTNIGSYTFLCCSSLASVNFEGAPPSGVNNASVKQDAAIRYNVAYEAQWLPVIEECGWTNAKPYEPTKPIEPGGEIVVPEGKAEEKAAEINSDPAVKAQYLKAPGGIETTAEYRECFNAVATSGSTVEFALSEKGTNEVEKATTTIKTAALGVVFSEGSTLTIDEPLVGFYYSLRQGGDLSVGAKADLNKLGGRDEISFELTKGPFQYFYQTLVTPTPVSEEK